MLEEFKKIPGNIEDLKNAKNFWDEYNITLPKGAKEWVEAKLAEPNPQLSHKDKKLIQYFLAYGQCDPNVEIFKNPLFNTAIEASKKIVYNYQFDLELEEICKDDKN